MISNFNEIAAPNMSQMQIGSGKSVAENIRIKASFSQIRVLRKACFSCFAAEIEIISRNFTIIFFIIQ